MSTFQGNVNNAPGLTRQSEDMAVHRDTANSRRESPVVTVIIPAYNSAPTLQRAIDSALAQEGCRLEIIVIDDGSTDETPALLATYGKALRVFRQENAGVSAARNAGIESATGTFIAFLDADDEWLPGKLAKQLCVLQREPDVDVVYCGAIFIKKDDGRPLPIKPVYLQGDLLPRLAHGNFIMTSSVLVRAACLTASNLMFARHLKVGEDYVLWLRLATSRRGFAAVQESLVRFAVGGREAKYPLEEYSKLYLELERVAAEATELSSSERARLRAGIRSNGAWGRAMYLARERAWSDAFRMAATAWLGEPFGWRGLAHFLWHGVAHRR